MRHLVNNVYFCNRRTKIVTFWRQAFAWLAVGLLMGRGKRLHGFQVVELTLTVPLVAL